MPDVSTRPSDAGAAARSTREALAVFVERRTVFMVLLGFAAGLPFLLIFDTLSAQAKRQELAR